MGDFTSWFFRCLVQAALRRAQSLEEAQEGRGRLAGLLEMVEDVVSCQGVGGEEIEEDSEVDGESEDLAKSCTAWRVIAVEALKARMCQGRMLCRVGWVLSYMLKSAWMRSL